MNDSLKGKKILWEKSEKWRFALRLLFLTGCGFSLLGWVMLILEWTHTLPATDSETGIPIVWYIGSAMILTCLLRVCYTGLIDRKDGFVDDDGSEDE
jgi:hypothetical protein